MNSRRLFLILSCTVFIHQAFAATLVVTNSNDAGSGSLRQAIFDANDTPGPDIIWFSIAAGPQTIELVAEGLTITDPITIDGSTQPGFEGKPIIVLAGVEDAYLGLRISSSNCLIRALVISNFTGHGILLETDARDNLLGGTNSGAGNIIVSNLASGVTVLGTTNNAIRGNAIFRNGGLGIDLQEDGVTSNDDMDSDLGPNTLQNFPILSSATISSNSVAISGSLNSRPTTRFQIDFFSNQVCDDSGNGEGETYLGTGTVDTSEDGTVSFNVTLTVAFRGRYITATATDPSGNSSEFSRCVRAVSTLAPLTFFVINTNNDGPGSLRQAILDANARLSFGTNRINFNIPGTESHTIAPSSPLPGILESVVIDGYSQPGASGNTLSDGFNARILIRLDGSDAGAESPGLALHGDNSAARGLVLINFQGGGVRVVGARGNVIEGNLIGLDGDGSSGGNGVTETGTPVRPGILLADSSECTVGGITPGARNVVSANGTDGIQITGEASTGNQVLGNFIGTDATGMSGVGNGNWGLSIDTASATVVGGTSVGAGNLISWNGNGILISSGVSNSVQGNLIGSDVTGTNALGNGSSILIIDSWYNLIGGPNLGARNIIVANGRGIEIVNATAGNNVIQGNSIGTDATGRLPLGNGSFGIRFATTDVNLVGGTNAGMANHIAFNLGHGVEIAAGQRNALLQNSIYGNDGLGIALSEIGVTANDPGDSDNGPNQLQNFPALTSVLIDSERSVIHGTLDSLPDGIYRIELFDNETCDSSGYGEGQIFLASINVTTDLSGHASFSYPHSGVLPAGHFISATATDSNNNTSEFSICLKTDRFALVTLKRLDQDLVLEWPTSPFVGGVLETTIDLTPPVEWTIISNATSPFLITNSVTESVRFYRLRTP